MGKTETKTDKVRMKKSVRKPTSSQLALSHLQIALSHSNSQLAPSYSQLTLSYSELALSNSESVLRLLRASFFQYRHMLLRIDWFQHLASLYQTRSQSLHICSSKVMKDWGEMM